MNKAHFLPLSLLCILLFLFIKIYQHNKIIKLTYAQQRIEKSHANLTKEKNKLLLSLNELQDRTTIKTKTQEQLKMNPLKISQIISFTN